jgi:hypothetical protein
MLQSGPACEHDANIVADSVVAVGANQSSWPDPAELGPLRFEKIAVGSFKQEACTLSAR